LAGWWLAAGGAEGDLMRLAGWKSRSMVAGPPRRPPSSDSAPPTLGWASVAESGTPVKDRRRGDACGMGAVAP